MRIAFERAGGRCVFSSEIDKYASRIYEDNHGAQPSGDITKIPAHDIPAHDILVAGFPCQPFSIARGGSRKGLNEKGRGECFGEIARVLSYHHPKMFLLENVLGLINCNGGDDFSVILSTLEYLGYDVSYQVINASLLLPQNRKRVYLVGTKPSVKNFFFPAIEQETSRLGEILENNVGKKYTLSDKLWKYLSGRVGRRPGLCTESSTTRTLTARYWKDGAEILLKQAFRNPRRLTPLECSRLMGFPKNFKINVSDTQAYKCFGNSVAVPIVCRIASAMSSCLTKNKGGEK